MDKVKKTILGAGLAAAALIGGIAVGNAAAPDNEATCHTSESGETVCTVSYEEEDNGETSSDTGEDYEQSSSEDPRESEGRKKTSVKIEYVDYEEKAF